MSARRTERLLNVVICLLATRRWLTKEQIRSAVPQYAECDGDEAFDRMFERDKDDLRELGVPLVTGSDSSWFEDETGYRIDRDSYALPELDLTAPELAVLGLASRVWQQATLAGPAARALVKLRAIGVETDENSLVGVEPRVRTAEPAFVPLYAATRDRAPVAFRYRKPSGDVARRKIEPWAVTSRGGRWYVAGFDRDRGEARVFRLTRIEGAVVRIGAPGSYVVPPDVDAGAMIQPGGGDHDVRIARVRVRPGRGAALRLRATAIELDPELLSTGWDLLHLPVGEVSVLAEELTGYGADVVALEPEDLRDAVVRRLRGALAAASPELAAEPVQETA